MKYSYVLLSEKDGEFYIGSTGDLRVRVDQQQRMCALHCLSVADEIDLL